MGLDRLAKVLRLQCTAILLMREVAGYAVLRIKLESEGFKLSLSPIHYRYRSFRSEQQQLVVQFLLAF